MLTKGIIAGTTLTLALTACSSQQQNNDADYLKLAHIAVAAPHTSSVDKSLIRVAHAICDAFTKGSTWDTLTSTYQANATDATPAQAQLIVAAAVGAYCPQYKSKAPAGTFTG